MGDPLPLEKRISSALAVRRWKSVTDKAAVPAAVLILLFQMEETYHILLTKRSDKVAYHKGEVSFPGGTVESQDTDLLETALRESFEEIGVRPEDVTVLGRLDDMLTATTGFVIAPFVGTIPHPYPFHINSDEISELIFVPLDMLQAFCCGTAHECASENPKDLAFSFHYGGNIIWGATARILKQFMNIVGGFL
jgi:8-oxo-dGTP pyrophosphatase MutT (NUDIX family)